MLRNALRPPEEESANDSFSALQDPLICETISLASVRRRWMYSKGSEGIASHRKRDVAKAGFERGSNVLKLPIRHLPGPHHLKRHSLSGAVMLQQLVTRGYQA